MWIQKEIRLSPKSRGFHLVTDEILGMVPEVAQVSIGFLHIFIKHTSASVTINENADAAVRADFESFFNRNVPEDEPYYQHDYEGGDDLPAHIKASILGNSVTVPITKGYPNLGTWQGIYLCEHRNSGGSRSLVITVHGE